MLQPISLLFFLYVFLRLIWPLPLRRPLRLALGLVLALIAAKFALYAWLGGAFFAPELPRALLLLTGWLFNALLLLCVLLLLTDLAGGLARLAGRRLRWAVQWKALSLVSLALLLAGIGTHQAIALPQLRTHERVIAGLPPALDGLRIVHLTDLHLSALNTVEWAQQIVARSNAAQPDLILVTGDLVDGSLQRRGAELAPLAGLRARYGVFLAPGNHEYYSGYAEWMAEYRRLGMVTLENAHVQRQIAGVPVVLAGVTDPAAPRFGMPGPDLAAALAGAPQGALRLLLAHQPREARANAAQGVALQVSGHTHGGMMPGLDALVARFNEGWVRGWYDVGGMALFVGPGAGLWGGLPLRLGVPSEISLIVLRRGA